MLCYPPPLPVSGPNALFRVFVSLNGQNYNSDGVNVSYVSYKTVACPFGQVGPGTLWGGGGWVFPGALCCSTSARCVGLHLLIVVCASHSTNRRTGPRVGRARRGTQTLVTQR